MENIQKEAHEAISNASKQDFRSWDVLGRVLVGLSFVIFGISHFTMTESLGYYVPGFLPFESLWVILIGITFVLGGGMLALNKRVRKASLCLVWILVLLSVFVYLIPFSLSGIFQNIALIGALLLIANKN